MQGLSLFAGAGIGETFLKDCGIHIKTANELLPKRAKLYQFFNPDCNMICGDITDNKVFRAVMTSAVGTQFLLASPPCQGMSIAGKNRHQDSMSTDPRNYLIVRVFEAINKLNPKYVLIENVPMLLKFTLPYRGKQLTVMEILKEEFSKKYKIEGKIMDASDCGVPQTRLRAIIKMFPLGMEWPWPEPVKKKVTVKQAIGKLPSLESGESSNIRWHFARRHPDRQVLWMKHTPTGKSAFSNPIYFPQKEDGTRIKGYESSYRRIRWDEPSPTITIRNDAISSQRNVHPGRPLKNGTFSDARVLSLYELFLLTSLPKDWCPPMNTPEILLRQVIGEAIPPLMIKRIVEGIR